MKRSTLLIFSSYFFLCLTGLFLIRLFLLGSSVQEEYQLRYPLGEEFISLELSSGAQIPFLRLHNKQNNDGGVRDEDTTKKNFRESPESTQAISTQNIYDMYVFPEQYYDALSEREILQSIDFFLRPSFIQEHIGNLTVLLFGEEFETRGRMRDKRIYLYSVERLPDNEVLSVFIHEFAHYYDIYGLPRSRFGDMSDRFYNISWEDVDILKAGQEVNNFVSGYAMTNQYEDFAESYTYYVLHNAAFREKSLQNPALAQKYAFFEQYTFPKKEFYKRSFATDTRVFPYYWDITKIEIEREKFLQYIKIYL